VSAASLASLLESRRLDASTEAKLQAAIAQLFTEQAIPFDREVPLSAQDRIDFLLSDGVGCEVKIGGGLSEVTRQLHRYAQHDRITELVLVTSRLLLARVPAEINGKPVRVAALIGWM